MEKNRVQSGEKIRKIRTTVYCPKEITQNGENHSFITLEGYVFRRVNIQGSAPEELISEFDRAFIGDMDISGILSLNTKGHDFELENFFDEELQERSERLFYNTYWSESVPSETIEHSTVLHGVTIPSPGKSTDIVFLCDIYQVNDRNYHIWKEIAEIKIDGKVLAKDNSFYKEFLEWGYELLSCEFDIFSVENSKEHLSELLSHLNSTR